MFDKHIHQRGPVTVHEHRAPTDESVKIYDEMLRKARAEIATNLVIETPFGNARVAEHRAANSFDPGWMLHFSLNGKEFHVQVNIKEIELAVVKQDKYSQTLLIARAFANAITEELIK